MNSFILENIKSIGRCSHAEIEMNEFEQVIVRGTRDMWVDDVARAHGQRVLLTPNMKISLGNRINKDGHGYASIELVCSKLLLLNFNVGY